MLPGCTLTDNSPPALDVPRGYVPTIEIELNDRILGFGPFVGYYFRPDIPEGFSRLKFVCFNEQSFYTNDLPANSKLFEGEAVLTELTGTTVKIPDAHRINPVFFPNAPVVWLKNRPEPQDEFVHFHSCYDAQGPVLTGYWLRHRAITSFTYDMGGRVDPNSPLYHEVTPGIDSRFAQIVEFDRGPSR
jgi:hypothetical protein